MESSSRKWLVSSGLIVLGIALALAGIYVSELDDAPGAALIGVVLMVVAVVLAVRVARRPG